MAGTKATAPLNSAELNSILNGTTEDTPIAQKVQEQGSPDEFSTPLQDFELREATDDGENSQND
jgi:hypothetical protein